ncbi:MAG: ABC transporter C-terminal domain-containing protein, partial [Sphingobacterium paramultivorum]
NSRRVGSSWQKKSWIWNEQKIEEQEILVKNLESKLADEAVYSDATKLQETTRSYNSAKALLTQFQESWEQLAEEIMDLEND